MANTDSKVDFLWKKILFGVSKTDSAAAKFGSNETIPSKVTVFGQDIWAQTSATDIPATPPVADTAVVKLYTGELAVASTVDSTSEPNRTWLTALADWIPATFGANYSVSVYAGNPAEGGTKLFPDTTNEDWVFDYSSGVLHFPSNIPAAVSADTPIFIEGYRYVGNKGLGGAGANIKVSEFTYTGVTVETGNHTFADFFANTPQTGTIDVMFNGVRLDFNTWNVTGRDLVLNLTLLPYSLESSDTVSAQYGFAG